MAEWRKRDYQNATKVTKELLELWRAPDRAQPLFYAQVEAAETVIFLTEGPADLRQGIRCRRMSRGRTAKEAGYKAFQRYALKMATGSGKTTVMGMLAAWSILNKVDEPAGGGVLGHGADSVSEHHDPGPVAGTEAGEGRAVAVSDAGAGAGAPDDGAACAARCSSPTGTTSSGGSSGT